MPQVHPGWSVVGRYQYCPACSFGSLAWNDPIRAVILRGPDGKTHFTAQHAAPLAQFYLGHILRN